MSVLMSPALRPQAEQVTDRVNQIGAIHGVEVKIGHAAVQEIEYLLGGNRGGDQLARCRIVIEAVETVGEPVGNGSAAARRECACGFEVLNRQDSGNDRDVDARRPHAIEIPEIETVLEKELRDGPR